MAMHGEFRGFDHLQDACVLTEDGSEFPVHRVLLALKSEYFHDLLRNIPQEETNILVPGIQGSTMRIIMNYIYTGELDVQDPDIRDILVASYFLGIDNLLTCSRNRAVRSLTTTNCVSLYLAAYKIDKLGILKACNRFIVVNFQSILRNPNSGIEDLPVESLEKLLTLDTLNVSDEIQIWEAINLWVGKMPEKRENHLETLITHIRFGNTDGRLALEILEHPIVKKSARYDELNDMITKRLPFFKHRIPEKFFVFTKTYWSRSDYSEGIKIKVTYDENIDVWRHLSSKAFCPDVILHGSGPVVVMFKTTMHSICSFDVVSNTWSTLSPLTIPRREYNVVKLESHIYVLGGISPEDDSDEIITTVERYNFESETWEFASPHLALSGGAAVAINGNICIVGAINGFFSDFLTAQVYDPDTDTWHSISAPKVFRRHFAFAVYESQLFVLGGQDNVGFTKSVEAYSAEDNEWRLFPDLPFPYLLPKAVVIRDVLYVYDNNSDDLYDARCPPVFWDGASGKWEVVEASSPFCDLHLYQFCTIEDSEVMVNMRRDNRDAGTIWEKSPFFPYLNTI